jgi:hypothetical protein
MKIEDELKIEKLITDYMCWWDDRAQHKDYPSQLDENATWELWQMREGKNVLFDSYQGKAAILAVKTPDMAMVHSTTNLVVRPVDEDHAEARAYFRTYFRDSGELWTHGEGGYQVRRVDGEWRLMSIRNQYYWIKETGERTSSRAAGESVGGEALEGTHG